MYLLFLAFFGLLHMSKSNIWIQTQAIVAFSSPTPKKARVKGRGEKGELSSESNLRFLALLTYSFVLNSGKINLFQNAFNCNQIPISMSVTTSAHLAAMKTN